jgi:hypothetical protein
MLEEQIKKLENKIARLNKIIVKERAEKNML